MKKKVNKILVLFFVTLAIGFSQNNYSLSFDGNSHVSIPTDLLDYDEPRTILLQVKNNGGGTIYSNFTNETGEYSFGVYNNGPIFQLKGQGGWVYAGENTETINGEWMYVVGTWDLNEVKLYENGTLVDSNPLQGTLAQNTFNGSAGIGVSAANWNSYLGQAL